MTDTLSELIDFLADDLAPGTPECCGVITVEGEIVQVPNIHAEPLNGFHMDPSTFVGLYKQGIVATWHTHPAKDPNLSHEDMAGFRQWPGLTHHIVGIRDGEPTVATFVVKDGEVLRA